MRFSVASTTVLAACLAVGVLASPAEAVTVYADAYGFNTTDSTSALQSAINSGADTVIVRNMGSPWIVRPMQLASNQHIIFEEGVVVQAKSGSFTGTHDCLFTASQKSNITLEGYGATFRMNKQDYVGLGGEWRHGIRLMSSHNVNIYGLTIESSGGDGIYLGASGTITYNSNIHIKDVISDNNYRQGISIISVDGLRVENSQFINTNGTAPQAGMDFESNSSSQRLANIEVKNVSLTGNAGWGMLVWAYWMTDATMPISMNITNSQILGNGLCVYDRSSGTAPRANAPTGNIYLRGVTATNYNIQPGMQIQVHQIGFGDANGDGSVDVADLGLLGSNYGMSGKTWLQGDFNGDGTVDVADLGILGANYGSGSDPQGQAQAVPEPSSLAVLALAAAALIRRRCRGR